MKKDWKISVDQCQVFRGFLTRQLSLKRLVVTKVEQHAMGLEAYKANLAKLKAPASSNPTPSVMMPEERANTYKEATQQFPLQTRAIEGLKALRNILCSQCADRITFEMVRTHIISNDPAYVPAYQRLFQKRSRSQGPRKSKCPSSRPSSKGKEREPS